MEGVALKNKKSKKLLFVSLVAFCAVLCTAFTPVAGSVFADGECTGILPNSWCAKDTGLQTMIHDLINIGLGLVMVTALGFIVYCGFIWATAGDNPGKVETAKKRILELAIGLLLFFCLGLVINFVLPGVNTT